MADIALNKLTVNVIAPTLYENTTLSPVHYLFEFINKQSFAKYYCIPTELSNELLRYNKFHIEDKVSPNPLNGEVNLPVGSYDYYVYEQLSSTNLDPTGLNSVEEGMAKMYGTRSTNTYYPSASPSNTLYGQ